MTHLSIDRTCVYADPIIKTWSLGSLNYLKTHKADIQIHLRDSSSLDTLEWRLRGRFRGPSLKKTIEIVSFRLRCFYIVWDGSGYHGNLGGLVTLPTLRTFTLIDDDPEDCSEQILRLCQLLEMPVLAELCLKLDVSMFRTDEFTTWLETLKNPNLKKVDVVVTRAEDRVQTDGIIRGIFLDGPKPGDLTVVVSTRN
jgi:hypothetical protein